MASIPSEQVVKIRAELGNAVIVRPGDKLVIATPQRLSAQQAHDMMDYLAERLPGVGGVFVSECTGLAVYRESDDTAIGAALREIWNRIEDSDEVISPAWLRRVIVMSGAWRGHEDDGEQR